MESNNKDILKNISPRKIILPTMIGMGVFVALFFTGDEISLEQIMNHLKTANLGWIGAAVLVLVARDTGYIYRIRNLTHELLTWKSSLFVILLWEFASAVTPSVVGGTAIAVFIMNKEGIPFGKSLAYVMLTAAFDNLFFVVASLLVISVIPFEIFPEIGNFADAGFRFPLRTLFIISVSLVAIYTFVMLFGLFGKPRVLKWLLVKITFFRIFRRWRKWAVKSGNEMIMASKILKGESWGYWGKALLSTIFIWSARYFMLNCLIAAFTGVDFQEHLLIFSRQIIMWVVMLISPTPGSSGTAEYTFGLFFGEFFEYAGLVLAVALFWRIFTYFAYLLIGAIALPRWINRVFYQEQAA